mmetsp:Transcript_20227/g.20337  ORF Transcript_20227/g.20337 Transcript_20227/m.20337 type:complete len:163 (+) Transcript_20227:154-642(+)
MSDEIECIRADLTNPDHGQAIIQLLDMYASDPCGGAESLSEYSKTNLISELIRRPTAHIFLAKMNDNYVGLANCFEGFSTFLCKPILNIHDFAVDTNYRRRGISKSLLAAVEQHAKLLGCCKVTLEVLDNNIPAKNAYLSFGFEQYALDPKLGGAIFFQKYC